MQQKQIEKIAQLQKHVINQNDLNLNSPTMIRHKHCFQRGGYWDKNLRLSYLPFVQANRIKIAIEVLIQHITAGNYTYKQLFTFRFLEDSKLCQSLLEAGFFLFLAK